MKTTFMQPPIEVFIFGNGNMTNNATATYPFAIERISDLDISIFKLKHR